MNSPYQDSPSPTPTPEVTNYMVWAILSTLCCCLPAGGVSIFYAYKCSQFLAMGSIEEAREASKLAKYWAIGSAVAGIVGSVVWFIIVMVMGAMQQ